MVYEFNVAFNKWMLFYSTLKVIRRRVRPFLIKVKSEIQDAESGSTNHFMDTVKYIRLQTSFSGNGNFPLLLEE